MKCKLLIPAVALIMSAMTTPSSASSYVRLYGTPAEPTRALRTIVIGPDTRYVNVTEGDIIKFVAGDQAFGWEFDTALTVRSFDLKEVAPPGALDHTVTAYIAVGPRSW
ncbi:MAG: hypothetical protein V7642_661 [Burkholderiales bacterium]|jgi:hypothetical protein